jgi:hypothetical protein
MSTGRPTVDRPPLAFRRGELVQVRHPSGGSGTGVVAQVAQYSTGWIAVGWLGEVPHVTVWTDFDALMLEHEHYGAIDVRWLDPDPFDDDENLSAETPNCLLAGP